MSFELGYVLGFSRDLGEGNPLFIMAFANYYLFI